MALIASFFVFIYRKKRCIMSLSDFMQMFIGTDILIFFQISVEYIFNHYKQPSYYHSLNKEQYVSFGNNLDFEYQYNLAFHKCSYYIAIATLLQYI